MTNKPRIYTSPSAFPNPQRLRLFLHEKGIADQFEEFIYDMAPGGDQRKWPHTKMNPWGETPTLALAENTYLSETGAIVRYLDTLHPGRKITGDTALKQGLDTMWENRIWTHVLYRIVTMFHVQHQGLGSKLELTHNPQWGEHCRKEALMHSALIDRHLADGRPWMLGDDEPTFADITLCTAIAFSKFPVNATPLDERFEHIDAFWKRWQARSAFKAAYADKRSGIPELDA
ncbi:MULTISPECIES: glutathione S-transferase family protein [unclassified Pseudomonas]|uniref:glutathione S-transferase family protein n=1 Tax=unclassified Pseudomonas TaxID=196821 RepID=UPI002AC9D09D|nr:MULTISPECIES: glutathione S-transferase N-terminal domain-containing protein [unclassified Pseudomonas]MEB0048196.1 glutathione S-transferase N-terminal domain-containing protein [Pseudomonas sp. Dout3]MEB0096619.1 glutathione S-transferase N-terminal domain-containing protein [Pseudomonas sp. DC1.2]WPX60260.1 glutathione S-transferase N-terminal domain-containing protein [Pseudomonas sp. DC1.2]